MTDPTQRLTADQIFDSAAKNARDELERSTSALAVSGLAGGIVMGLTGLSVACVQTMVGNQGAREFISLLFYPLGFIAVIVGRAQLFTENTLYPVLLILQEKRHIGNTLRLWGTVFATNVAGALVFALLAVKSGGFRTEYVDALSQLGVKATQHGNVQLFWSGVFGGWLIALVAWSVTAARESIGELVMTWLLTFAVGVGHFAHCIAGSCEVLSAVVHGALPAMEYLRWITFATLGNIAGGVILVSLLNYGQVHSE